MYLFYYMQHSYISSFKRKVRPFPTFLISCKVLNDNYFSGTDFRRLSVSGAFKSGGINVQKDKLNPTQTLRSFISNTTNACLKSINTQFSDYPLMFTVQNAVFFLTSNKHRAVPRTKSSLYVCFKYLALNTYILFPQIIFS